MPARVTIWSAPDFTRLCQPACSSAASSIRIMVRESNACPRWERRANLANAASADHRPRDVRGQEHHVTQHAGRNQRRKDGQGVIGFTPNKLPLAVMLRSRGSTLGTRRTKMGRGFLATAAVVAPAVLGLMATPTRSAAQQERGATGACAKSLLQRDEPHVRSIAAVRTTRFEGKLDDDVGARCLGGQKAVAQ